MIVSATAGVCECRNMPGVDLSVATAIAAASVFNQASEGHRSLRYSGGRGMLLG